MTTNKAILIANFGGPRDLKEIPEFLEALLTDRDVIHTSMPPFLQRILFKPIARKRAKKVAHDYLCIGGKSPIFADTEALAQTLAIQMQKEILTFHRYLPSTHQKFIQTIENLPQDEILVFPMFPQFSYATTGSIARWFAEHLSWKTVHKLRWIKSYCDHPEFIASQKETIRQFLSEHQLTDSNTYLLLSAHGLPRQLIDKGDLYEQECDRSFQAIKTCFPEYKVKLAYQSKFGPGEWLRPYTDEVCQEVLSWHEGKEHIVIVPIAFTSDHIETLFEIEQQYLPPIRAKGLKAYRCPALNLQTPWIEAVEKIILSSDRLCNDMLIRRERLS
jgi:protoporphyrin/coproporphyrin ferrochelatase